MHAAVQQTTGLELPLEAVRSPTGTHGDEVLRLKAWVPHHARTRHVSPRVCTVATGTKAQAQQCTAQLTPLDATKPLAAPQSELSCAGRSALQEASHLPTAG